MIQGRFSNGQVIAQSPVQDLEMLESVQMRKLKTNPSSRNVNGSHVRGLSQQNQQQQLQQQQQKMPIDYTKITIQLPGIPELKFNEQLTKPSYLQAVKQIPLPKKELEEKIMINNKEKVGHYQFIMQLDQIIQQDSSIKNNNNINNNVNGSQAQQQFNSGYFFDVRNQQGQNNGQQNNNGGITNEEQRQLNDFMNFACCQDKELALKYIQKFPYDTETQVKEYLKDEQEREKQLKNEQKIEQFKEQTGQQDQDIAKQYLEKYNYDLFIAVENYQQIQKEAQLKEKIIEFKKITMCNENTARKYLEKTDDLIKALELFQQEEQNKMQNQLQEMKMGTNLSDSEAQWYLEAAGNDVEAAKKMYNDFK